MSETESFGPRLRAERERRGISIDTIASVTKVGHDLWEGLERNDFSRWPSGIFARAFVRDYARAIALDSDEVVNEFCRLFPIGDRRSSRLIQAQAQLIGHELTYAEPGRVPPEGDRRVAPREQLDEQMALRLRILSRSLATTIDSACTLGLSFGVSRAMSINFWAIAGVITVMYYTVMTIAIGTSPGIRVVHGLGQRVPALLDGLKVQGSGLRVLNSKRGV
jgi:transcriptional regulator with XRE-family HTH domain